MQSVVVTAGPYEKLNLHDARFAESTAKAWAMDSEEFHYASKWGITMDNSMESYMPRMFIRSYLTRERIRRFRTYCAKNLVK